MSKDLKRDIGYFDYLFEMTLNCLEKINNNTDYKEGYIYSLPERAKFKRLRLEITKGLLKIENKIYGRDR